MPENAGTVPAHGNQTTIKAKGDELSWPSPQKDSLFIPLKFPGADMAWK